MSGLKAVLFDMDGVIVDTELEDFKAQVAFVKKINEENGRSSEGLDFKLLLGKSYALLLDQLYALTDGMVDAEELWARFLAFDAEWNRHSDVSLLYRPETEEVLSVAKAFALKTAVVSSSSRERIEEVLNACGIRDEFDLIVSGALLERSKPDPTIYRNALADLSLAPEECVAIEDSTCGIEAALAAGIPVIAYEEVRVPIDQTSVTWKARSLSEAASIIRSLAANG